MKSQMVTRLLDLNKQFYQTFGYEFSSTRLRLQPGVLHVLDRLSGDEAILDLGCGNGELTRELMRRGHRGPYTGLDFSLPLLEVARHGWEDSPATFLQVDLTAASWGKAVSGPFDVVFAFAVLHHIPGAEARRTILNKVHHLMRPGGLFVHSEWQFLNSEKLKSRVHPWSEVDIASDALDPGDALLDWRSGGRGLRYVHSFSETELDALAVASGFRVRETFLSDGENNRLGLYQAWEAVRADISI
ncbi:MAG TPA: class I SAM-dependent methyltransferase [Anaerolineales bacterium]|nr:class I SAM-dependent methyltransferase [Anaerolineales bacterium]